MRNFGRCTLLLRGHRDAKVPLWLSVCPPLVQLDVSLLVSPSLIPFARMVPDVCDSGITSAKRKSLSLVSDCIVRLR